MMLNRELLSIMTLACALGGNVNARGQTLDNQADIGPRALVSGSPVPVGTHDRRGPLSAGLWNHVRGTAILPETGEHVLFVVAGRHSAEPGLFLYTISDVTESGVPVFTGRTKVRHDFIDEDPKAVVQSPQGDVLGLWVSERALVTAHFDRESASFAEPPGASVAIDVPGPVTDLGIAFGDDGSAQLLIGVSDGARMSPGDFGGRDPRYRPFDGRGIWRGEIPYCSLWAMEMESISGPTGPARRVSTGEREVMMAFETLVPVHLAADGPGGILTGSRMGNFLFYPRTAGDGLSLEKKVLAAGRDGVALRHPVTAAPMAWFDDPETGVRGMIVGGEGSVYFYRFTGEFTPGGAPIFDECTAALEEDATLFVGTLSVNNVVDWDGDGIMDLVSGNSEGTILHYKNAGTNDLPAFLPGVPIQAAGRDILIQGGYNGSIQGPGEARWGYVCPTVVDWNGDGLLDIVMSDITADHTVFINSGTIGEPKLAAGRPIYCDGLELHGAWRVQPAVANMAGRMAYVALDGDDEFHLYWRIDDYNLEDAGKLHLEDGSNIRGNFLDAGGTGRLKLIAYDWDGDGATDLIVGTPRHGSVPDPETGLPQSLGLPGAAVLFLKNVGTDEAPVFRFPELFAFRGEPIFLGQHAAGPAVADFGREEGPGLVVGDQEGRLMYYARKDLTP